MADAPAETPGSSTGKLTAVKDRECQYCHQAFTSSSLGRHLDLYIKGKNAKPPDDIHDVEEIRRLRGNVTRRQARTSSGKRESSTSSSAKPTPLRDQRSPSIPMGYPSSHVQHSEGGPIRTYLNKPNWQATGVINDLPSSLDHAVYNRIQSPSRRAWAKTEITHKQSIVAERDRARAAEMALKEVLESVKVANLCAHPPSPFDFNFLAMSFPELCLQCLKPPQSLLANPDIPTSDSWSHEVPKIAQLESLRGWLDTRIKEWQRQRQHLHNVHHHQMQNGTNGNSQPTPGVEDFQDIVENYKRHLSSTFESWKVLPDRKKQDIWVLECAKAYAREEEIHKETRRKLEIAEQEIQQLRSRLAQQVHELSDISVYGPDTLKISSKTTDYLPDDSESWEYDNLLSKWRTRIQTSRNVQQELPPPSSWAAATPSNLNNGVYSQTQSKQRNGANVPDPDGDEDLVDAPGDEDDMSLDRGVLDPTLRDVDIDGEGQAGGRMLMGLKEYDGPGVGDTRVGVER